MLVISVMM